ncbi:MAG: DUF3078 domain-containing protein [Tannerella sp.]|jgi:hypothetical protein|nr:DUF3078 domain-containing protein [Tannerella sp.]
MGKRCFFVFFIFSSFILNAQDLNFDQRIRRLIEHGENQSNKDGTPHPANSPSFSDTTLQVTGFTSRWIPFGPDVTYQDTIIVSQLFLKPVFQPKLFRFKNDVIFYQPEKYMSVNNWDKPLYESKAFFEKEILKHRFEMIALQQLQRNVPSLFKYSIDSLPSETIREITNTEKPRLPVQNRSINPTEYEVPAKFIPDRKYWISSFESAVKFSENSTSANWHSSPSKTSILNLFTRNIVKYNYAKDLIKWDNDMEIKLNLYNAPNDTLRKYKVSDDLLKLHSNIGLKAFKKWHYTFDVEFKTQLFRNFLENTNKIQAAILSPYTFNFGLGMKYDHTQKYKRIDRSLVVSINIAPLAYTYMSTINDSINLGRYGFPKDEATGLYKTYLSNFGSSIDFNMTLNPNRDVTWKSRLRYFTSYNRVVSEFENSLDFAVSRFFSTLLYLHLRYDDGVTKIDEKSTYLQWSQLISFGFNYKW